MKYLSKERFISLLVIVAVCAYAAFITGKLFENKTVMLIDNEAKPIVEFCQENIKICEVGKTTYEGVGQ